MVIGVECKRIEVLSERASEDERRLREQRERLASERVQSERLEVLVINRNRARGGLNEAKEGLEERGFASASPPDDAHFGASGNSEREVFENERQVRAVAD